MCINFHVNESKLLSLGMQRINGSMKAENAVLIIAEKLSEFGFNLIENIVGIVTDGAAVVEKTSRLSEDTKSAISMVFISLWLMPCTKRIMQVNMKMSHLIGRLSVNLKLMKTDVLITPLK